MASSSRSSKPKSSRDASHTPGGGINVSGPGIWVTYVRGKERFASDSVKLALDELVEELYPGALEEHRRAKAAARAEREGADASAAAGAEGEGDVPPREGGGEFDDELRRELEELRLERESAQGQGTSSGGAKGPKRPPALVIKRNTDVDCLLFFSVLPPLDPLRLTLTLLSRLAATGRSPLEHVQRLLPTTASCSVSLSSAAGDASSGGGEEEAVERALDEVRKCAREKVLPGVFDQGRPVRFKVLYQSAQPTGLARDVLIRSLALLPPALSPLNTVDLSAQTDLLLSARVFRSTLSLGVIPNAEWERLKRFNVGACKEVGLRRAEEEGTSGRGGRVSGAVKGAATGAPPLPPTMIG